MSRTQL